MIREEVAKSVFPVLEDQAQEKGKSDGSVSIGGEPAEAILQDHTPDGPPATKIRPFSHFHPAHPAHQNGTAEANGAKAELAKANSVVKEESLSDTQWPTALIAATAAAQRWKQLRQVNEEKKKERDPKNLNECERNTIRIPRIFNGFPREDKVRQFCFHVYRSPLWSAFFLIVAASNAISIAVAPSLVADFNSGHNGESANSKAALFANVFDLICFFVLTFEIMIGVVAVGFWGGPRTWLRATHYHKLDFATWVVALLEYVALAVYGVNGVNLRPFRMLRFLRPVSNVCRTGPCCLASGTARAGQPGPMLWRCAERMGVRGDRL